MVRLEDLDIRELQVHKATETTSTLAPTTTVRDLWVSTTARSQCTRVGNSGATKINLHSGVIQGSCLGPLLFILYTIDIVQLFDDLCVSKLYADDLKRYSMFESPADLQSIQDALNGLFKWADTWQLGIAYKNVLLCLLAVTV